MKRLILILLCCIPFLANAEEYVTFYPEEIHGPVKMVIEEKGYSVHSAKSQIESVQNGEIYFYDSLGREYKNQQLLGGKIVCEEIIQFYGNDSSLHTIYDENGEPNGYTTIHRFDELGRVRCYVHMHDNKLWYRDSLTYNERGKIAEVYHSHKDEPYSLSCEYSFDSQGNVAKMRDYWGDGSLHYGFDAKRIGRKLILERFGQSFKDSPMDRWEVIITYDEEGHVVKAVNKARNEEYTFSDFDDYGNWTKGTCKAKVAGFSTSVVSSRKIVYWGQSEDAIAQAGKDDQEKDLSILKIAGGITLLLFVVPLILVIIIIRYDRKRSTANNLPNTSAPLQLRFAEYFIDFIIFRIIFTIVRIIFVVCTGEDIPETVLSDGESLPMLEALIASGIFFFYYIFFEARYGATPGKKICRTKVVDENGDKPSLNAVVGRTFCRCIPFEFISFFFTDKDENGNMTRMWHDTIPHTRVVRTNAPATNTEEAV